MGLRGERPEAAGAQPDVDVRRPGFVRDRPVALKPVAPAPTRDHRRAMRVVVVALRVDEPALDAGVRDRSAGPCRQHTSPEDVAAADLRADGRAGLVEGPQSVRKWGSAHGGGGGPREGPESVRRWGSAEGGAARARREPAEESEGK